MRVWELRSFVYGDTLGDCIRDSKPIDIFNEITSPGALFYDLQKAKEAAETKTAQWDYSHIGDNVTTKIDWQLLEGGNWFGILKISSDDGETEEDAFVISENKVQ